MRAFAHIILLGAAFALAAAGARAQTPTPAPRPAATPPAADAEADEDFQLDIDQRRIVESDFRASTAVEAGGDEPGGLDLKVGAAVRAADIDVLLRNVRGRVRFRASLGPVLRLLAARRGPPTAPPRPDPAPE